MDKSPEAFRTISEVAEALETPAHVLRFWESRFPQIRPVKRAGGRRYYRPADVALLAGIKRLLHEEGMTIRGVQKILREQGTRHVSGLSDEMTPEEEALEAAMAGRADGEPGLPPDQAEAETAAALEAALQAERGVVLPFPPAAVAEAAIASLPETFPAGVEAAFAEASAASTIVPDEPPQPAVAAPSPPAQLGLFSDLAAAEPAPPAPTEDIMAPTAVESADPAVIASETATIAARLRALPLGSLHAHAEPLAKIAARIAALRNQLASAPPHG